VIESAGSDADENVAGADRGLGGVGIAQDFWSAVLGKNDCFHEVSSLD
jgi:hypothetical protein